MNTRRQIGVLALVQPGTQAIGIVVSFVLARQLFPRDYGMVAMATGFTGVLAMVSGLGLSDAALQRKELSDAEASALFWLNVAAGLVFGLAAVSLEPVLGWYFQESSVPYVSAWAGLAALVSSLGGQHRIALMRRGAYGSAAVVDLVAQAGAGIGAIGAAVAGLGWKSLVVLFVGQAVLRSVGMWVVARWVPGRFRWDSLPGDTVRLGLVVCLGWVLYSLSATAESAVLGRVGGAEGLGLYTKAMQIARYPVMIFFVPAFLPAVHRLGQWQDNCVALGREYARMQGWVMLLISLPAGALAGCAADLVPSVMGRQWEPSVPLLLVILAGVVGLPVAQGAMWVLTALARKREMALFQTWMAMIPVAAITVGALLGGAMGACVAFTASMWAALVPVGLWLAARAAKMQVGRVLSGVWRALLTAGACALATWGVRAVLAALAFESPLIRATVGVLVGATVWMAVARVAARHYLREILDTVLATTRFEGVAWARRLADWYAPTSVPS